MKKKIVSKKNIIGVSLLITIFFLFSFILLFISPFQTFVTKKVVNGFSDRFNSNINLNKIKIQPFGNSSINDIIISNNDNDTLLYLGLVKFKTLDYLLDNNTFNNVVVNDFIINYDLLKNNYSDFDLFFNQVAKSGDDKSVKLKSNNIKFKDLKISLNKSKNISLEDIVFEDLKIHNGNFDFKISSTINNDFFKIKRFSINSNISYADNLLKLSQTQIKFLGGDLILDIGLLNPSTELNKNYFDINLIQSKISKNTLKSIIPKWPYDENRLKFRINGDLKKLEINDLLIKSDEFSLLSYGHVKNIFDKNKTDVDLGVKIETSGKKINFFAKENINKFFKNLNKINFDTRLKYSDGSLVTRGNIISPLGNLSTNAVFHSKMKNGFDIKVSSEKFDLGNLILSNNLGFTGLEINLNSPSTKLNKELKISGKLFNTNYRNNFYEKIELSGNINNKVFNGSLSVIDKSVKLDLVGMINYSDKIRDFSISSDIKKISLEKLDWISNNLQGDFSGEIEIAMKGRNLDDIIGDLYIKNGKLVTNNNTFNFSSFSAQSRLLKNERIININSEDIISGLLVGKFEPSNFFKTIKNIVGKNFKNYKNEETSNNQSLSFNFNLKNKITSALSKMKFSIDNNTFISGNIDSKINELKLKIESPMIKINDFNLNNLSFEYDSNNENEAELKLESLTSKKYNFNKINYTGGFINRKFKGGLTFYDEADNLNLFNNIFLINDEYNYEVQFEKSEIFINNKKWELISNNPKIIMSKNQNFDISNFSINNKKSFLHINKFLRESESIKLDIDFENIFLKDFTQNDKNKWEALIDGNVTLNQSNDNFRGNSSLEISNLHLNEVKLGNALIFLKSDTGLNNYKINFELKKDNIDFLYGIGDFGLDKKGYNFSVDTYFNNYDLSILNGFTNNIFNPFYGNATGMINFSNKKNNLIADGELIVDNLNIGVKYLNTDYLLEDNISFMFNNSEIKFSETTMSSSKYLGYGKIKGELNHNSFKDWSMNISVESKNLNILSTNKTQNASYYGNAFFDGDVKLFGQLSDLKIDLDGKTSKNTKIYIPINYSKNIGDVSFINFQNKNSISNNTSNQLEKVKGLEMNFNLDINPNAEIEIVLDSETNSFINGVGNGSILFEIDTFGSFEIWGDFVAEKGTYNFKNLGLIDKKFELIPGGTIIWNGNPKNAQINMQAVYNVPGGASPSILIDGDNANDKIPTEVTISLFGDLINPETPTFEINFPNTSAIVKNELNYKLNDQERRQLQAISLLSQGSFINDVSVDAISNQALSNNLFQKASSIFENIFKSENDRVNFGLNYLQGDRNAGVSLKNRDRLGLTLSTNINERILIDGKLGVPVGSEDETVIIGDVKIEFLLNNTGDFKARIFNRENEFQYFGDELGYTQGIGFTYQVTFNSFKNLVDKIFNNN